MGGYYQQKRRIPFNWQRIVSARANASSAVQTFDLASKGPDAVSSLQSTYSYRSGLPRVDVVDQDPIEAALATREPREDYFARQSGDTGHPFRTVRTDCIATHPSNYISYGDRWFSGPLVPRALNGSSYGLLNPYQISDTNPLDWMDANEINFKGKLLIDRARPLQSYTSVSTALAEILRDGLPSMPLKWIQKGSIHIRNGYRSREELLRDKLQLPGRAGQEYLNWVFGFEPLASDIAQTLIAIVNSKRIIDTAIANSGKLIHRRRSLKTETTNVVNYTIAGRRIRDVFDAGAYASGSYTQWTSDNIAISVSQQLDTDYYFTGAFQYYLSKETSFYESLVRYEQLANALLGTRITPSTWWELMPFSWLIDWFAGVQNYLNVYSAFENDGLIMPFAYLMRKRVLRTRTETKLFHLSGKTYSPASIFLITQKERVRATPYGFGLDPSLFNARQWAILAALGLTKAPHKLLAN